MRTLANAVELDLAVLYATTSRAAGTVGTVPFITNTAALSAARKILVDNGAPTSDLQLVIDTNAGANLHTLYNINSPVILLINLLHNKAYWQCLAVCRFVNLHRFTTRRAAQWQMATSTSRRFTVGQTVIPLATRRYRHS